MKIPFTTLLVFVITITSQAQLKDLFTDKGVDLTDWTLSVTEEEKQKFIEPLRNYEQFEWPFYNGENYKNCLSNFHIIDFDQDGKKDIFYNGSHGGEGNAIILMRKSGNEFEEVLNIDGRLISVSRNSEATPMRIAIEQYGCCMEMTNQFEIYYPIWNEGNIKYELALKYGYTRELEFPKVTMSPIAFVTINNEYKLRLSPTIDDGPSKLDDGRFHGNILAVYPKGSKGTAIAENIDDTGRTWWFVIMKNNIEPLLTIMNEGINNSSKYYTMGWMSSRYVKKIN